MIFHMHRDQMRDVLWGLYDCTALDIYISHSVQRGTTETDTMNKRIFLYQNMLLSCCCLAWKNILVWIYYGEL